MTTILMFLGVVVAIILAWNFLPGLREKMRGSSTIVETILGVSLYYMGILGEAFEQLVQQGYIPEGYEFYVPAVLGVYYIIKRLQTKTPAFKHDSL